MTVRDLGYKPYDGPRRPPSENLGVLLRFSLRRAWRSWLVKLAVITAIVPPLFVIGTTAFRVWLVERGAPERLGEVDPAELVLESLEWQTLLFVTLITTGAGATSIAEDRTYKTFPFYFSKPVTALQYLLARVFAVAVWSLAVLLVPALLEVMALAALVPEEAAFDALGLVIPATIHAVLVASSLSLLSVAVSAVSPSRALTSALWIAALAVPYLLSSVVDLVTDTPWAKLVSPLDLLETIGRDLFKLPGGELGWLPALAVLGAAGALAAWGASARVRQAEVFQ